MDSNVFLAIFLNIGIMIQEDVNPVHQINTIIKIKKNVWVVQKDSY